MEQRHLIKGGKQWRSISKLAGCQPQTFALSTANFSFQVGPSPQTSQVSSSGLQLHSYCGPDSGVAALEADFLWGSVKLLMLTFFSRPEVGRLRGGGGVGEMEGLHISAWMVTVQR